ncbi:MAG: phage tail spike protein [Ruminococcus sp.]
MVSVLDFEKWLNNCNGATRGNYSKTSDSITLISTSSDCYTDTYDGYGLKISVTSGKSYTLSWDSIGEGTSRIIVFSGESNVIAESTTSPITFTVPSGYSYIKFRFGIRESGKTITFSNAQITTIVDMYFKQLPNSYPVLIDEPPLIPIPSYPLPHGCFVQDGVTNDGYPYIYRAQKLSIFPQPIPPKIHVYPSHETDFSGNGLAIIDFTYCHVRQEKNGMYEIELTAPVDDKTVYLKKQAVLKVPVPYRDSYTMQLFRVYAVKKTDTDSETGKITLNLRHIFYDISRFTYGQISIENKSGQDALTQMLGGGWFGIQTETMPFTATSNISTQLSEEYEYVTVTAALIGEENSFINRWGGELFRDNFRFSINSIMENSQTSGVIRYATNMAEIEFTEDDSELLTDLIAWDNFGQKKTISNPDIPTDEIPHRIYKCVHFNYAKLNTAQFESDAQKYFDTYSQTQVNIRAKLAQLPNTDLYAGFRGLNNYEVGDRIIVYHSDLDIYYSNLEIISREFDVVICGDNAVAENVDIEIGTFKNAISRSAYMSETVYRESEKRIPEIISRLEALESQT